MNPLRGLALASFLYCLISSSISMASLINYTANGFVSASQGQTIPITGQVYIDDQLRDMSGQPTQVQDIVGLIFYHYDIIGYFLNVGQYAFSGSSGELFTPIARYPTLADWDVDGAMWSLSGGDSNSQWTSWTGDNFTFCNLDGTPKDFSQYCSLANIINLDRLMLPFNDPIIASDAPFNLRLVENGSSSPVPEPTAIVLLGAGLLGMGLRKHHRRRLGGT